MLRKKRKGGERMLYHLEQNGVSLTVSSRGAEVQSLKTGDVEWMWRGDPAVWGKHAPLCFPWCGRLKDGYFVAGGVRYENGNHGFAWSSEHALAEQRADSITFCLESSPETLARWPWAFRLETTHALAGRTLTTTCVTRNTGGEPLPLQIGFHFAFALPEEGESVVKFQCPEEPVEIVAETGFVEGTRPRFTGQSQVILDEHLFDHDSICMSGLKSRALRLERGDGRALEVGAAGFPYVLLWSKPGKPQFLCIEPWHGLPDAVDCDHDLFHRPAVTVLAPGEEFTAVHTVTLFP